MIALANLNTTLLSHETELDFKREKKEKNGNYS